MSTFYLDNIVEAEKRINHPKNLLNGADFKTVGQGQHDYRGDGNRKQYRKLSPETKGLVSALAQVSGVKETAKNLGIPPVMVGRYKAGLTADGNHADPEVRQEAKSILDTIGTKAASIVQDQLVRLSNPAFFTDAKATEVASIASLMMNIVEKTQPKGNTFIAGKVIFMVPPSRGIEEYNVIDVVPTVE